MTEQITYPQIQTERPGQSPRPTVTRGTHSLRQFLPAQKPEVVAPLKKDIKSKGMLGKLLNAKPKPSMKAAKATVSTKSLKAKLSEIKLPKLNKLESKKPQKKKTAATPIARVPLTQAPLQAPQAPQNKARLDVAPPKQAKPRSGKRVERRQSDRRRRGSNSTVKKADFSFQSLNKYLQFSYLSLFLLVFVFGGWTFLAKIQGAVVATGQVAVEGKPKIIQHLEGGIVSEIAVKEGDFVSESQTVMKLDATILNANLDTAETNFFENEALVSRLLAEKSGEPRIKWSRALTRNRSNSRVGLAMSGQEQLFQARRSALSGEIAQFAQRIEQYRDEDSGIISEINFTRSELSLVDGEFGKMTELLRQNLISRNRVTQLERDRTRLRNAVSKLETRRASLSNSIKEAQISIDQVQRLRNEQILTDLRLAQTQADSFSEALKTVSTKTNSIHIQAPVAGVVHEMSVSTVGGVIAPGQEIMKIIPERESLVIKAQVMPQDIDQVSVGQKTNVVFSALKQSAAPELDGTVSFISADNLVDPITGSPYFEVEIDVADAELPKLKGQSLLPGMPADIFIQTNKRTVFDYLTGPLKDTLNKTMRDG